MTGKVWLVGAGPSGAELLTIKGKNVIEQADAVVCDALVGLSVLALIPPSAERFDVGKRAGCHSMPQGEINKLLLSLAQEGKKVVRLKGGDPFLFGRGGEELELLKAHRIPFEIVPGVTSATAVPAYFGIPVTHRELASSVHIITGHQKKNEPLHISFQALKEAGGTLVFLMGAANLHDITKGLLGAGMDPEMPAAVLQQGAGGRQKKIGGTLATLEQEAERQKVSTPAIIVVGEVVRLGEEFAWFEKLPLFGKRFLVTRPRERGKELSDRLREGGAEVLELPTIAVRGIHPNPALREEILRLGEYRFLVFTSPAGVTEFMRELLDMGKDVRWLGNISVAAIGSGTAGSLRQFGIAADLVPEVYSGKALGELVAEHCKAGDKVLIARSDIGNPELAEELRKKGIAATDTAVYRTLEGWESCIDKKDSGDGSAEDGGLGGGADQSVECEPSGRTVCRHAGCGASGGDVCRDAENGGPGTTGSIAPGWADPDAVWETCADGVFFTSASTVRGFTSLFPGMDFSRIQALCIGEMTGREAEKWGMRVRIAKRADVESLVELVMQKPYAD